MSEPNREKVLHWLECLIGYSYEYDSNMAEQTIALIKELTEEKSALEYKLLGVMHSVDKWLEGDELEQDEVNRAATMREKTLRIVEELAKENEELNLKIF